MKIIVRQEPLSFLTPLFTWVSDSSQARKYQTFIDANYVAIKASTKSPKALISVIEDYGLESETLMQSYSNGDQIKTKF